MNASRTLRAASALLGLLFVANQGLAQLDRSKAPEPGPAPELNMGSSTQLELENGLNIIVVENHRTPSVYWNLTLEFPPFLEGDKAGLQAVASDMMSAGTDARSKAEIAEEVEFLGATFFASSKGFYARSLTKHTGDLLRIVSDAVLNPTFPQEELDKVKTQYRSGLSNIATDPGSISSNLVNATNYGSMHPYGEITTEETIDAITREDLLAYHKEYYRPNAGYLIVVGDITPDEAYAKANAHFGSWRRGNIPFARIAPAQLPKGREVRFSGIDGAVQSSIKITQPAPYPPGHPDAAAIQLMNAILGGSGFSGRLMQNLREDKAYTYGARSSLSPDPVTAEFIASAEVRSEVTDSAIVEFLHEINRIRDTQVDSADLATAKASLSGSFARSLEDAGTVARFALNIARYKLPQDYYDTYLARLDAVTIEDVQRAAKNMIKPNNLNICVVGSPDVADRLAVFDTNNGIDRYDAFGTLSIPRVDAPEGVTAKSILGNHFDAIGGAKAWGKLASIHTVGSMEFGGGMSLELQEWKRFDKKNPAIKSQLTMAGQMVMGQSMTSQGGLESQTGKSNDMDPDKVAFELARISPVRLLRMEKNGYTASVLGQEPLRGEDCYVLEFAKGDDVETYWFQVNDGLMVQSRTTDFDGATMTMQHQTYMPFGDNGLKLAAITTTSMSGQSVTMRLGTVEFNPELTDADFQLQP